MPAGGQAAHQFVGIVDGKSCTIKYNDTSCAVSGIPSGDRLVRIIWGKDQVGRVMGQISFWINVKWNEPATVVIPSSNVRFETVDDISPYPGLDVFVRASMEAVIQGEGSLQTTKNANNTGFRAAVLEHSQAADGVTFPVLAGCYSIAVLGHDANNIARVNYPQPNLLNFGGDAAALCVGGNDTTVHVEIDPDGDRVVAIKAYEPSDD